MCSIGLRLRYGAFDYFTGGDMPVVPDAGAPAWQSVETAVACADQLKADHVHIVVRVAPGGATIRCSSSTRRETMRRFSQSTDRIRRSSRRRAPRLGRA
jgi:hypothetical protein